MTPSNSAKLHYLLTPNAYWTGAGTFSIICGETRELHDLPSRGRSWIFLVLGFV